MSSRAVLKDGRSSVAVGVGAMGVGAGAMGVGAVVTLPLGACTTCRGDLS